MHTNYYNYALSCQRLNKNNIILSHDSPQEKGFSTLKLSGKLKKYFKEVKAVDSVSFSINQGEIFGLLGPNGAGKTTILNILCTLLKPTLGTATICNYDIKRDKDAVRRSIGIVFQDPSLDDQLTAHENLEFHGRLYHIPKNTRRRKIGELLTTHYMDEADLLCHRVAIIDRGKISAIDTPTQLKKQIGGEVISIKTEDEFYPKQPWIKSVNKHDGYINLTVEEADQKLSLLMKIAQEQGIAIDAITIHKPTLEDVFLHFTGKTIREEEAAKRAISRDYGACLRAFPRDCSG